MSEKNSWLRQESQSWVTDGLISAEQRDQIVERYPAETESGTGSLVPKLLMGFAAGLVGIGLLLFVASNWAQMSNVVKVVLLNVVMLAAYAGSWQAYRRGRESSGAAFALLGSLTFGAAIFLIGQMYHLVAFNANALLTWAAVTLFVAYLTRSRLVFVAALSELLAYDLVNTWEYHNSGWIFLVVMLLAVPFLRGLQGRRQWVLTAYMVILTVGVIDLLARYEAAIIGVPAYALLLYFIGLLVRRRSEAEGIWLQLVGVRVSTLFVLADLVSQGELTDTISTRVVPGDLVATGVFAGLYVLTWGLQLKWKRPHGELLDGLYFVPVVLTAWYGGGGLPLLEGLLLAVAALFWILQGGAMNGERYRLNNGSVLFGLAVFGLYVAVASELLQGAAGFLVGGIVLFAVAFLLERNRRRAMKGGDGS
ncbi:DUF2157 domain-containing protein [Tumebacillus sp. DT12]|uniref:DUF2157 domain-containing protein n=1 Tax=Tumebacillus lacus TaxID=2995335 RepID=A0ABT3X449_9BACL|nr:DUF2157 domain-containing protein [Tumebacillus lacus]MCX7571226.1 DUF2157 domain-containing protein [Tumebacillus lacus]